MALQFIDEGLVRSDQFKLWMMVEIPSNVILLEDFIKVGIDGVSVGSNDLTMLVLGTDRDNNLVAKEFVASREDEDGVLLLSQFTGASRELKDAVIVNPYDIEQMADAIHLSLAMKPDERSERMKRMRAAIKEHNIYRWAGNLITELARLRTTDVAS